MRKLFTTCSCGQQMQVPRSAIGKMGQCPSCGEKIPITRETTSRTRGAAVAKGRPKSKRWGSGPGPSLDAKEQFGRAVDLYCKGSYGEALVIFDALRQEFPDSTEIERARQQCVDARNRDPLNLPGPASGQVMGDTLDENTLRSMRRIAVEKMLHGESDAVQIQAAELVARLSGSLNDTGQTDASETEAEETTVPEEEGLDEPSGDPASNGNGHGGVSKDDAAVDVDASEVTG